MDDDGRGGDGFRGRRGAWLTPLCCSDLGDDTVARDGVRRGDNVGRSSSPGAADGSGRYNRWTVTSFNLDRDEFIRTVRELLPVVFIVAGTETCPTTGRRHVQAYMEFERRMRWRSVHDLLGGAHVEPAFGTAQDNIEYCSKEGAATIYGTPLSERQQEGRRRGGDANKARWDAIRHWASNGEWGSIPSDVFIRYYGNLRRIKTDAEVRCDDLDDVCGYWIYGPPGFGKSFTARQLFPCYYAKEANKWWDRYRSERAAIIDDFELSHHVLGHHLKIWGDRYAFIGEVKHEGHYMRPEQIVVTSNYSIYDVFGEDSVMEAAIRRRYVEIHFGRMRMDISEYVQHRRPTDYGQVEENPNYFRGVVPPRAVAYH